MARRLKEIIESFLHHVSPSNHDEFHSLSHFGTSKAAFQAGRSKNASGNASFRPANHYKVKLNKGNVHKLSHDSGEHYPHGIVDQLHKEGVFSAAERNTHSRALDDIHQKHGVSRWTSHPEAKQYVGDAIRKKGIHTLEYKNSHEHPGSKSYIITHPSQVTVVKKHTGIKTEQPSSPRYVDRLKKRGFPSSIIKAHETGDFGHTKFNSNS